MPAWTRWPVSQVSHGGGQAGEWRVVMQTSLRGQSHSSQALADRAPDTEPPFGSLTRDNVHVH